MLGVQPLILDETADSLVRFLAEHVNTKFTTNYPSLPDIKVVKAIRSYDDIYVPLDQFPLLKVYRISDTRKFGTTFSTGLFGISYACSFPDIQNLPGILKFVADALTEGFLTYNRTVKYQLAPDNNLVTFNYQMVSNEYINAVYPFLSTTIQIKDDC